MGCMWPIKTPFHLFYINILNNFLEFTLTFKRYKINQSTLKVENFSRISLPLTWPY